jgi:hypothetical protein
MVNTEQEMVIGAVLGWIAFPEFWGIQIQKL